MLRFPLLASSEKKNIAEMRIKVLRDGMLITAFLIRAETLKSAAKAEGLVTRSGCRRRSDNIEETPKHNLVTEYILTVRKHE